MANRMPWFRLYSEILDDKKIKRICRATSHNKATVIGVWVTLLALANESDDRGSLQISEGIPYELEDISYETDMPDDQVDVLMKLFEKYDMIHFDDKEGWTILNWDGRQFKSDNVSERVAKHRAKKAKAEVKRYCNVIDTDTDTESDKDKEKQYHGDSSQEKNKLLIPAVYDENGNLAPLEDRIIEIFCDRAGLYGDNRPYENNPKHKAWYADWLKDAAKIADMSVSSVEMEEAIALLMVNDYSCNRPGALIETIKNIRTDKEKLASGEKNKLRRYELKKGFNVSTNRNEYLPCDWWQERQSV